jgi:hypothetical protein
MTSISFCIAMTILCSRVFHSFTLLEWLFRFGQIEVQFFFWNLIFWILRVTFEKGRKTYPCKFIQFFSTLTREQVVISRLRTGYTRATHSAVMDKEPSLEYPFCAVNLTTDHILYDIVRKRKRNDYKSLLILKTNQTWLKKFQKAT